MRTLLAGSAGAWLGSATDAASTSPTTLLLLAILGSGATTALIAWWRGRRTDVVDYTKAVSELQATALSVQQTSMDSVLEVQKQLGTVRAELDATKTKLSEAVERVIKLEGQLERATVDRERALSDLAAAKAAAAALQNQITTLQDQMEEMQRALEGKQPRSGP